MQAEKEFVISTRPGAPVLEDGQPKKDAAGEIVREASIPVTTVLVRNLTAIEAMDADDIALEVSKTGNPSRASTLKTYAICAVRKINNEGVAPGSNVVEYNAIRARLTAAEVDDLTGQYLAWAAQLNENADPKDSPAGQESAL